MTFPEQVKLITTSWDDGHEADFRLAALLHKYKLKGTFYIPKANTEKTVMPPEQVRRLSNDFEIGGHTLNHVRLHRADERTIDREINGCYKWLAEVTGKAPVSFCFPGGKYNSRAVETASATGYRVLRTTELLSSSHSALPALMPTTLQLYQHSSATYFRHVVKRFKWKNLIRWMKASATSDLVKLTEFYLQDIETNGGCFHLWGHSWEIDENNLWKKLEEIFKIISARPGFTYLENKDILNAGSYQVQSQFV